MTCPWVLPATQRGAGLRAGSAWGPPLTRDWSTRSPATRLRQPTSAELRRRVLATEEELDRAESRVSRLSPGLLAGRTGARPGADLVAVQQGLGDDAALVMYETFDEDLVLWAVEPDAIHHSRVRVPARDLACDVRRFHRACATGGRDDATAAALAKLLLEPVSEAILRRRRLYRGAAPGTGTRSVQCSSAGRAAVGRASGGVRSAFGCSSHPAQRWQATEAAGSRFACRRSGLCC